MKKKLVVVAGFALTMALVLSKYQSNQSVVDIKKESPNNSKVKSYDFKPSKKVNSQKLVSKNRIRVKANLVPEEKEKPDKKVNREPSSINNKYAMDAMDTEEVVVIKKNWERAKQNFWELELKLSDEEVEAVEIRIKRANQKSKELVSQYEEKFKEVKSEAELEVVYLSYEEDYSKLIEKYNNELASSLTGEQIDAYTQVRKSYWSEVVASHGEKGLKVTDRF